MKFRFKKKVQVQLTTLQRFVFKFKKKHSILGDLIEIPYYFLYNLRFLIRKRLLLFKAWLSYGKLRFKDTYWVDPKKLVYLSGLRSNKWQNYLRVLDGDWDLFGRKFEDSFFYQAFKQRFIEGQPWENTYYYQKGLKSFNEMGKDKQKYHLEKWDDRFKRLENLYNKIKRNGIKNKKDLLVLKGWIIRIDFPTILDNISVDIGRKGELLVVHGKNRLCIAKILNLPLVPITIIARHKNWMEFRAKFIQYFKKNHKGKKIYVFTHPDLKNIPFIHGKIPYDIIKETIKNKWGISL